VAIVALAAAAIAGAGLPAFGQVAVEPAAPDDGGDLWVRAAGAGFGKLESRVTPIELDFFDVSFWNQQQGVAGGARCRDDVPAEAAESAADYGERLDACERVPEIWRYREDRAGDGDWRRAELEGADRTGYVGALVWIDKGRALAVGGDGRYPRREPNAAEPDYESRVENDPAGSARAWLYDVDEFGDEAWHELTDLPQGMRGLTALDVRRDVEWGWAGGLGQLWNWEKGRFDPEPIDHTTDSETEKKNSHYGLACPERAKIDPAGNTYQLDTACPGRRRIRDAWLFELRVRDIRVPTTPNFRDVFAVTAGCCAEDPGRNVARTIRYSGHDRTWTVSKDTGCSVSPEADESLGRETPCRGAPSPVATRTGANSLYAITPRFRAGSPGSPAQYDAGTIVAEGGPEKPDEPPAVTTWDGATIAGSRLVAGDGDTEPVPPAGGDRGNGIADWQVGELRTTEQGLVYTSFPKPADPRPNQVPLAGCLPPVVNSGIGVVPGLNSVPAWRGIAGKDDVKDGDNDPSGGGTLTPFLKSYNVVLYSGCYGRAVEANGQRQVDTESREPWDPPGPAWAVDSYALNAVDMVGAQALGWAAGDRGALLRLGGPSQSSARVDGDPAPPQLGSGELELADSSPYDDVRREPAAGEPGRVPPLAARPLALGAGLTPVSFGSPDPGRPAFLPGEAITSVVMSRDGGEGWAIGPLGNGAPASGRDKLQSTLYHFDGRKWYRCDPSGLAGLIDPDPACAGLRDLFEFADPKSTSAEPRRVKIYAAARVPLEYDSNSSNDDEFEVVALATSEAGLPQDECPMLRYRDGRWRREPVEAARGLRLASFSCAGDASWDKGPYDLELAAPDDGWLVSNYNSQPAVHHYDGKRWVQCISSAIRSNLRECGNQGADGSRLPSAATGSRIDTVRGLSRAGRRVYMYGSREMRAGGAANVVNGRKLPFILYRDPGDCADEAKGTAGCWRASDGGLDPFAAVDPLLKPGEVIPPTGNPNYDQVRDPVYPLPEVEGSVVSMSVAVDGEDGDGEPVYRGWAGGSFKRTAVGGGDPEPGRIDAAMLRLDGGTWAEWRTHDAAYDNLSGRVIVPGAALNPKSLLTLPEPGPDGVEAVAAMSPGVRLLGFYPERARWEALRPNPATGPLDGLYGDRRATAVAADGAGGFWLATGMAGPGTTFAGGGDTRRTTWFHRFAAEAPEPVFSPVPSPIATGRTTALAGGVDGTVLVATDDGSIYRYDRLTGWERFVVPGWDPGRIVTRRSSVNAVALGPGGEGLAVGEEGRIARVEPARASLDPAAGRLCDPRDPRDPCGTSRDLDAVSIAPGGSAMVGGRARTLLWRPAGGGFRTIVRPPVSPSTTITGVSLPAPDRAWVATDAGLLYGGKLRGTAWSWELEGSTADGDLLTLDESLAPENALALRAVAVDAGGHGYAVGDRGLVLERTGDPSEPWRRLKTGFLDDLTAIALGPGGSADGALVGGRNGLILTLAGESFEIARGADPFRPIREEVRGLALVPGTEDGDVEAWAAIAEAEPGEVMYARQRAGADELLHYSSRPEDSLLDGQSAAKPLPDSPAERSGEMTFAAFGKSDCPLDPLTGTQCPSYAGSNRPVDRILDGIAAELGKRSDLDFVVHTGDAYENGADAESSVTGHPQSLGLTRVPVRGAPFESAAVRYRRFSEGILEPLRRAGTPAFGAIGGADVTDEMVCDNVVPTGICVPVSGRQYAKVGLNLGWKQGFGGEPAPWGGGSAPAGAELEFAPVEAPGTRVGAEDVDAAVGGRQVAGVTGRAQARTHYAVDVADQGRKLARLVVADNSLRSLAGSDPVQNPIEADGGQMTWLERMICIRGSVADTGGCSREPGQQAIVVFNTPTYSYGPGGIGDTASDSAQVETVLRRHRVSMVVSGRLGWNGRYWATAPGVHEPCPGGAYQERAPEPGTRVCGQSAEADAQGQAQEQLATALDGLSAPPPPGVDDQGAAAGLLPAVVAASAGGAFGPDGRTDGPAAQGFWRGYSVVRLDPSGDPRGAIVEQRPVLDWIVVTAQDHVLRPGQRMTLRGMGREPIGIEQSQNAGSETRPPRYMRIDSPAITHRYDLLVADPAKPWVPATDTGGDYIPLPPQVATVDAQTGVVRARNGGRQRTYAIGLLSVGDKGATYPVVFEPRRSFTPARAKVTLPPLPRAARAPAAQQPVRLADPPAPPSPPPATPSSPLVGQTLQAPAPPQIPSLASPSPAAPPPAPQLQSPPPPPAPPAPPNVPPQQQPLPLALNAKLQPIAIVPSVNPPAPPPVNPAPPAGGAARKEAKQRQAAAAKSEESQSEASEAGGDFTEGSKSPQNGVQAARRGVDRPMPSYGDTEPLAFSALERPAQPSAWARGALYGGGLGVTALLLAFAWGVGRPRGRDRRRELPAPARVRL
jgi:hypothetical protein